MPLLLSYYYPFRIIFSLTTMKSNRLCHHRRQLEKGKSIVLETDAEILISNSRVTAASSSTFSSHMTNIHTKTSSFSLSRKIQKKKHHKRNRKKSDVKLEKRQWSYTTSNISNYRDRVVFASYNILGVVNASNHPELYWNVLPECIDWNYRRRLLFEEIKNYNPGIICFQEVDRFDDLKYMLENEGYRGVFKSRTGEAFDGCAIFWNDKMFTIEQENNIEFERSGLRNNVAQLCVFRMNQSKSAVGTNAQPPKSPRYFIVGNTHILFNPSRGDIKLGQMRILLENAEKLSKEWGSIPIVLGGDLNSMPQSAMYQFITSSKLDVLLHDRKQISGQFYAGKSNAVQSTSSFQLSQHKWSDEELRLATGSIVRHLTHPLKLCSAYAGVPGSPRDRDSFGEPLVTSYHSKFIGTVDYIWHTPELFPVRVLESLPLNILKSMGGLPNEEWGSDHLALVCELAFSDKQSSSQES